ncbi:MAG: hypothetical protein AAGG46_11800, partial [Planctomycetota bacterium]
AQQRDEQFVAAQQNGPGQLVTILPGSRTQEIKANLAEQLRAAHLVSERAPGTRFAIAVFKESQRPMVERLVGESGVTAAIHVGRTPELIAAATCCLAVSGSVSLELLHHAKPTVIVYRVSRFGFFVQNFFRRVRYITLVNLLTTDELFPADAGNEVGVYDPADPRDAHVLMPEYLSCEDVAPQLAGHLLEWLGDAHARSQRAAELAALRDKVGHGGASRRAAEYIARELASATSDTAPAAA